MTDIKTQFTIIGKEKDSFIESYIGEPLMETDNNEYFLIVIELLHKFLEGETIAESITEAFRKTFYQHEEVSNYHRFEEAIKVVNKQISKLETEEGLSLKNINIAITALVGNELFLTQSNDAEVYLIRKGYLSIISEGLSTGYAKPSEDIFKNISSGTLSDGDQVVLSSGRILRYITKTEFGKMFYGKDLETGLTQLQDSLSTEVLGRLGILGMTYLPIPKLEAVVSFTEKEQKIDLKEIVKNKDYTQIKNKLINYKNSAQKLIQFFDFAQSGNNSKDTEELSPTINHHNDQKQEITNQIQGNFYMLKDKLTAFLKSRFSNLTDKNIKFILTGGSLLLILFVFFLFTRGAQLAQIAKYEDIFTQARNQIASARNTEDKLNAQSILQSAEESISEALDAKYVRNEANRILAEIKTTRFEFDEVILVEEPNQVVDLSEVTEEDAANHLIGIADQIFAINPFEVIEILLDSAKDPIKASSESILDVAYLDEPETAYLLTKSSKFISYNNGEIKTADTDGEKLTVAAIAGFGDRLYGIDNDNQQIWKFTDNNAQLSNKEGYLKDNKLPKAKDIAIDGSVYILTANNQLIRYFGGKISNFKITDAPLLEPVAPEKIYTELDSSNLYLLDSAEKRILVYFKNQRTNDLDYVRQYVIQGVGDIQDFYTDEDSKKLYILAENIIYITDLK